MGCGSSTATNQTQISKVNLQYKYLFKYIIVGDTGLFLRLHFQIQSNHNTV